MSGIGNNGGMGVDGKQKTEQVEIAGLLRANVPETRKDVAGGAERKKKVNWSKVGRVLTSLAIGSFVVPFCAVMAMIVYRNVVDLGKYFAAEKNTTFVGEFDPSMGEQIHSQNGRALVVVHEGYGMEVSSWKYKNDESYQTYLRQLEAIKKNYYENGDIILEVFNSTDVIDGLVDLQPERNTMYLVTAPNSGDPVPIFITSDHLQYIQSIERIRELLKGAGVKELELAGEFRGGVGCEDQVAHLFSNTDLKISWSQAGSYPNIETPELTQYPTLEPIP